MNNSITPAELINSWHVISYVLNLINRILVHLTNKDKSINILHHSDWTDKSLCYTFVFNDLHTKITFRSLAINIETTDRDQLVYKKNTQIAYGDPYTIYTREIDSLYSYIKKYDKNSEANKKQISSLTADLEQAKDSTRRGPEAIDEDNTQSQTIGIDSGKFGWV